MKEKMQQTQPDIAPTQPPAGEADPLTVLAPATAGPVEEKIFLKTTGDTCEVAPVGATIADPSETLASFHEVEKQVYDKLDELADDFQALMRRFDDELLPIVDRAQAFLSTHGIMHVPGIGLPPWPEWRSAFLKKLKMKMSVRTLQRKLQKFRQFDEPDEITSGETDDEADSQDDSPAPVVYESPKELLTKRLNQIKKVLSEGSAPVDADPLRNGERRISDALELVEVTKLAIDEGLVDGTPDTTLGQAEVEVTPNEADSVARAGVRLAKLLLMTLPKNPPKRMAGVIKLAEQLRTGSYSELSEVEKAIPAFMMMAVGYIKCLEVVAGYSRNIMPMAMRSQLERFKKAFKVPDALFPSYIDAFRETKVDGVNASTGTQVDGMSYNFYYYAMDGGPYLIPGSGGHEEAFEKWKAKEKAARAVVNMPIVHTLMPTTGGDDTDAKTDEKVAPAEHGEHTPLTEEEPPIQLGAPSVWRLTASEKVVAKHQDETEHEPDKAQLSVVAEPELVTIEPTTESIGIPGCSYIYAPKGKAGEYAPLAANPYRGCGHGCSYCYVPLMLKMKRPEFDAGAKSRPDFLKHLAEDARKYQAAGITEQVFFSFTTDVYSPFDISLTRPSLQLVQQHGMGICVLTKGGTRALADIDLYRPDRDCFASTLTSLDESFSRKWERNAAPPDERIAVLKAFHERGIYTWVSLEPTLSVEASLEIVKATHGFVDHFKVGKANYLGEYSKGIDWRDYTLRMIDLCQQLAVKHYIKRDLQPYLPTGYDNPMRVAQHF